MAAPAHGDVGGSVPGPGLCSYPGIGMSGMIMGADYFFCDFPTEENGSHWHCEYGGWTLGGGNISGPNGGIGLITGLGAVAGSCTWRWPDNTLAPAPNPPGAWKNYLVPKLPPPEHRESAGMWSDPQPTYETPPVPGGPPAGPAVTNPAAPNPEQQENPRR